MRTHCDVGESPLWYTRSLRNRVWKAVGQLRRQCQSHQILWQLDTHAPGAKTLVQLVVHSGQLSEDI